MQQLKVLFVGIGSIAKRHIRNLYSVAEKRDINLTVDAFRRQISSSEIDGICNVYTDILDVANDYNAIFITNPTEKHLETLKMFHDKGKNFFIEKPVVSLGQLKAARDFKTRPGCVYYVACPLRYNAVIQFIKENISPEEVLSVRSISSSYLPDWRPGQDYRETYSAHKDMGGGVSIDLIHEWDYITYLFGCPKNVKCFIGKKSSLEIDSDDYAIYIAEYADKIAELHLDYFGRKTIRKVELFTIDDTIVGDIANSRITFLRSGDSIDFNEQRDDYQIRELEHFLNLTTVDSEKENGFYQGINILGLTQGEHIQGWRK